MALWLVRPFYCCDTGEAYLANGKELDPIERTGSAGNIGEVDVGPHIISGRDDD